MTTSSDSSTEETPPIIDSDRLWSRLHALAEFTEADRPWTRRAFTDYFERGRAWLQTEMEQAGLTVEVDAAGNLIGTLAGSDPDAKPIASGSHSDTVPRGGRFDGIAGVIAALEVAQTLAESDLTLKHPVQAIDFLAEEPNQYGVSCVGSRAIAGELERWQLDKTAADGTSLGQAIDALGGNAGSLDGALRVPGDTEAFVELHIEQGPVLEAEQLDIGIVTDIVGITRYDVSLTGSAAHSGTTPMNRRQDALAGAAHLVAEVERRATAAQADDAYLVATVGKLDVTPNGSNVVPGRVDFVLEVRSSDKQVADAYCEDFQRHARETAQARGLELEMELVSDGGPALCADRVQRAIEKASSESGMRFMHMSSGAGHDAAHMAPVCPSGMIFIPCLDGRSHCPEEWASQEQVTKGTQVLLQTITALDNDT